MQAGQEDLQAELARLRLRTKALEDALEDAVQARQEGRGNSAEEVRMIASQDW